MKTQIVNIEDRFYSLGDLDVDAGVVNIDSGINEVRLAFDLTAAQSRQDAIWLDETDSGLSQANSVAIPERKLSADKIRIVKDRVKTICLTVRRILIALCPEERSAKPQVVVIDGGFDGRHVRTDMNGSPGNQVAIITTECVVITVGQIQ